LHPKTCIPISIRIYNNKCTISLRKHLKSDDKSLDLVTSWVIESNLTNQEFKDYSNALKMFSKISNDGMNVILYEIKRNRSDGSTVKKTPILNSKKAKTKPPSFKRIINLRPKDKSGNHPRNKNKYKGFKVRIILLIIVLVAFIILVFFMNSIGGESSSVTSNHYFTLFGTDNSSWFSHINNG
jgi:hypothetical protein